METEIVLLIVYARIECVLTSVMVLADPTLNVQWSIDNPNANVYLDLSPALWTQEPVFVIAKNADQMLIVLVQPVTRGSVDMLAETQMIVLLVNNVQTVCA